MDISLGEKTYTVGIFDSAYTFPGITLTVERTVGCYEIEFFDENGGVTYLNGTPYKIRSGCILCARPGDKRYTELPLKAYYIKVDPACTALADTLCALPHFFYSEQTPDLIKVLKQMLTSDKTNVFERHSLLFSVFSILSKETKKRKRLEQIPLKKNREAIDLGIEYIEKHFREKCTLEETAAYAHFSPVYFHGMFKLATGKSPYEYLISMRIEEAKRLLITEKYSMVEIAQQCGFTSQSYFNYVFKRETNQTPSAYRRSVLERYLREDGKFLI